MIVTISENKEAPIRIKFSRGEVMNLSVSKAMQLKDMLEGAIRKINKKELDRIVAESNSEAHS